MSEMRGSGTITLAVDNYLSLSEESRLLQRQAAQSSLTKPGSHVNNVSSRRDLSETGTSRLPQGSSFTSNGSLPCLSNDRMSLAEESLASSMGTRALTHSFRAFQLDGNRDLSHWPPLRTDPAVLQCPFDLLECRQLFHLDHEAEWRAHSISHFSTGGPWPRAYSPPGNHVCCFCDATFADSNGFKSWRLRMDHVAAHHRIGHSLSHARPDFPLYRYLWEKKLISVEAYNHINSGAEDRSKMVYGNPSPPISENNLASKDPSQSRPYTIINERPRHKRHPKRT